MFLKVYGGRVSDIMGRKKKSARLKRGCQRFKGGKLWLTELTGMPVVIGMGEMGANT
jgi:hypothetical protein